MAQLPIPVHVGSEPPDRWDDIEALQRQYAEVAAQSLLDKRRPAVSSPSLNWGELGFEPRWIGFDTADCAVALQPSVYFGQGADEFDRFRQGAESRGEIALVISPIGDIEGKPRSVLSEHDDSVSMGRTNTRVTSRLIGKGARVRVAAGLGPADGQLALRMLSCKPVPVWRSLSIDGTVLQTYKGREVHPAEGELLPILETELGEPVVAAWVSPDGAERRYVVPVETPWVPLLRWLSEQGLPEFVPGAMRRARRQLATDQSLMTRRERDARSALTALEADYTARRDELNRQLEKSQRAASAIREGLLYGTGAQLVDAVRSVFEFAGIDVVDLDEQLGGTKNADLLCAFAGRSRLVEVKSAAGSAPERAYQDLVRHLREWPNLPDATPVDGGALVMSHELRTPPLDRSPQPFTRPEFLAAQTEPVIAAQELFTAWREEDSDAIRERLFGSAIAPVARPLNEGVEPMVETAKSGNGRRRWFQRR